MQKQTLRAAQPEIVTISAFDIVSALSSLHTFLDRACNLGLHGVCFCENSRPPTRAISDSFGDENPRENEDRKVEFHNFDSS